MADYEVVAAIKRFFSKEETETAYRAAFAAYQERAVEVTITSANFESGSSSGQITGDPKELMGACRVVLEDLEADAQGIDPEALPGTSHVDFSKRILET